MPNRPARRSSPRFSAAIASAPWIVVVLGVAVMVVLLLLAVGAGCQAPRPVGGLPAPEAPLSPAAPAATAPQLTSEPASPVPTTVLMTGSPVTTRASRPTTRAAPSPSGVSSPTTVPPPTPSAGPGEVTGGYQVLNSYPDSFIAEVRVVNGDTQSRGWIVRLSFPPQVEAVRTSWVESAPQPVVTRSGDTYVFIGVTPVRPGRTVALRVHFERTGTVDQPTTCMVNLAACG